MFIPLRWRTMSRLQSRSRERTQASAIPLRCAAAVVLSVAVFIPASLSALDFVISGRVIDPSGKPVEFARTQVLELKRGVRTDKDGRFVFDHVPAGAYTVVVSAPGFGSETRKIQLMSKDAALAIQLSETSVGPEGIIVTGKSLETEALMATQPTTVVEGRELRARQGQNLGQTLNNTPGVSSLGTGNAAGKPFIRGLGGPRVLILSDGIRQEEQQFGDDHPVNLDGFGIEKVEVLRGPAGVLYGSDAIGGVVNVIRWKAPLSGERAPQAGGVLAYDARSNDHGDAKNASFFGYLNPVGYRVSADSSRGGRIRTPNGSLPNTGFLEENANATIGADGAWGNWYLDAFHRELRQDLLDNPNEDRAARPGAQNVHDKWHFHGFLIFPFFKLETDISSQRNNRREIPDKNVYYPIRGLLIDPNNNDFTKGVAIYQVTALPKKQGLNLELDTTTADVKVHHDPVFGLLKGTLGAAGVTQRNVTIGSEQLIPAYHLWSASLFAYEEVDLKNVVFSGGARIDRRAFDVSANTALGVTDQTRNFESKTASTGMVWRISKPFAVALNYGSGFRSPTPFELFANGVHEGTGKFEIGNRNLKPEVSKDIDLSFRFITRNVKAELTFFRNSIQDFIYSVSTGQVDGESGLTKYVYRQDPALLQGGELSLEAALLKWLVFQGGADVVRGTVEKRYDPANALNPDKAAQARIISELYTGGVSTPLPRVPADRLRLGFKLTSSSLGPLSKPYFSIAGRFIASQDRIDVLETRTPGYTLLDIGAGFEIPSLSNATDKATFDVAVLNATNEKYTDVMDRLKDFALAPGINITFKLTIPITLVARAEPARSEGEDRAGGKPEEKQPNEKVQ